MPVKPANEKLQAIRAILAAKGWKMADLSKHSGVSAGALRLIIYGDQVLPRRVYKIENALGTAVFSDPKHFERLRRASDFLGTDFVLTKFHPLRSAAVAKGVRHTRAITYKEALLARVLEHLAELETQSKT